MRAGPDEESVVKRVESDEDAAGTAVAPVEEKKPSRSKPKRLPPYHVILWNDDDHTVSFVVNMMQKLFGHPTTKGLKIAEEVHVQGRAIVLTTTKEHAELKRDQIHAFGRDEAVAECKGAMSATIEPSIT